MTESKIVIDEEFKALIQPLTDAAYNGLKKSVEEEGYRDPFVVWSGENILVDGHHRWDIGEEAGWQAGYEFEVYEKQFDNRDEAKVWIIDNQLSRRNLADHIKLELKLKKKDILAEKGHENLTLSKGRGKKGLSKTDKPFKEARTRQQIADELGWSSGKVAQGEIVLREAEKDPDIMKRLNKGESTLNKEYARLKKKEKEKEREKKRKRDQKRIKSSKTIGEILGEVKFSTVVVDPPWHPDDQGVKDVFGRSVPTYSLMRMSELKELKIVDYADENAHLYLWVTNRMFRHGLDLMDSWGFRYVTCLTWCKPVIGMGNYFRNNTEHVFFGVRGSLPILRKDVGTWFEAPRSGSHSEKPDKFYDLVEGCSPGPYLDIFSRREREGWVCYGDV